MKKDDCRCNSYSNMDLNARMVANVDGWMENPMSLLHLLIPL